MIKNLKLETVKDMEIRTANNNREYRRVTFNAIDLNDDTNITVKTSMSNQQWNDLKLAMSLELQSDENNMTIITGNPVAVSFEEEGLTTAKQPKPLFEKRKGTYKGFGYDFYEMNAGVLITNKIIQKEVFKKDYSRF